jgi:putative phosphoribosyl transferase
MRYRPSRATLGRTVDAVVCVEKPSNLRAVGEWYRDFAPTTDAEVLSLLRQLRDVQ